MLKGIDPVIHADLMHAMMQMGHGDDLVLCDINHPAATIAARTTYGRLLDVSGCGLTAAARAILTLFPLDTFIERPVSRMQVVGRPERDRLHFLWSAGAWVLHLPWPLAPDRAPFVSYSGSSSLPRPFSLCGEGTYANQFQCRRAGSRASN